MKPAQLKVLGEQLANAVERLPREATDLYEFITKVLTHRPEFGKRKPAPGRVRLLLSLAAAEHIGIAGQHTAVERISAYYFVNAGSAAEAAALAATRWDDHPGKRLQAVLQRSLQTCGRSGDPFTLSLKDGRLVIARGSSSDTSRAAIAPLQQDQPGASLDDASMVLRERAPDDVETPVSPPRKAKAERLARMFWEPHLRARGVHMAFGLPLFARSEDKMDYRRNVDANDASAITLKENEHVSYPFVSTGMAICMFRLIRWLSQRDANVGFNGYNAHAELDDLEAASGTTADVVAVGSVHVLGILREYQKLRLKKPGHCSHLPFQLGPKEVIYKEGTAAEAVLYGDLPDGDELDVPVVVTRREGARAGSVTLIASNNGRAVQRVGEILTSEAAMAELLAHDDTAGWSEELPKRFQILLYVTVRGEREFASGFRVQKAWAG